VSVGPDQTSIPFGTNPIQLYSLGTPNGHKVSIALEEMCLAYDAFTVDIRKGIQFSDWFKAINPNSKIPALIDREGVVNSEGKNEEVRIFESGAILLYLAEKTGKFIPKDLKKKMGSHSMGPMANGRTGSHVGSNGPFREICSGKDRIWN